MKNKKWIQIWYSWGEQEAPVKVAKGSDAWTYVLELAVKEASIAFHEHEDEGEIGLRFYEEEGKVIIHYPHDDEYCYYLITEEEEFEPPFDTHKDVNA